MVAIRGRMRKAVAGHRRAGAAVVATHGRMRKVAHRRSRREVFHGRSRREASLHRRSRRESSHGRSRRALVVRRERRAGAAAALVVRRRVREARRHWRALVVRVGGVVRERVSLGSVRRARSAVVVLRLLGISVRLREVLLPLLIVLVLFMVPRFARVGVVSALDWGKAWCAWLVWAVRPGSHFVTGSVVLIVALSRVTRGTTRPVLVLRSSWGRGVSRDGHIVIRQEGFHGITAWPSGDLGHVRLQHTIECRLEIRVACGCASWHIACLRSIGTHSGQM